MVPTIDHFIGQQDVIARFRVALEAAWNDGERLPHMLFVGPPGVGKTESPLNCQRLNPRWASIAGRFRRLLSHSCFVAASSKKRTRGD